MNRRAISPLIATVLLLAFAIAVGTMVMSYIIQTATKGPCDETSVAVAGQDEFACYTNGQVSFLIKNTGQQPISSLLVRLVSQNGDITEQKVAAELNQASATKIQFSYNTLAPELTILSVTPAINNNGEQFCSKAEYRIPLQECNP